MYWLVPQPHTDEKNFENYNLTNITTRTYCDFVDGWPHTRVRAAIFFTLAMFCARIDSLTKAMGAAGFKKQRKNSFAHENKLVC